ncbi:hypothetical protein LAZ95_10945 [Stenotrophomonas pavanii]|uniref:hypothetical protein n=1 Tax=Stenotrophomonas pavanii TaxID=487698 RepID=UPI003BB17E6D
MSHMVISEHCAALSARARIEAEASSRMGWTASAEDWERIADQWQALSQEAYALALASGEGGPL